MDKNILITILIAVIFSTSFFLVVYNFYLKNAKQINRSFQEVYDALDEIFLQQEKNIKYNDDLKLTIEDGSYKCKLEKNRDNTYL